MRIDRYFNEQMEITIVAETIQTKLTLKLTSRHWAKVLHWFSMFYLRSEYLEPSQTSMIERFSKIINVFQPLTIFLKAPSQMFDWVLNVQLNALLKYVNQKNIWVFFFHFSFNASKKRKKTADIYLFKVNNGNTGIMCEICSKLTIKTPECQLVSLLLTHTLNSIHTSFWCFHC